MKLLNCNLLLKPACPSVNLQFQKREVYFADSQEIPTSFSRLFSFLNHQQPTTSLNRLEMFQMVTLQPFLFYFSAIFLNL